MGHADFESCFEEDGADDASRKWTELFHKHKCSTNENDWAKFRKLHTKYHKGLDEADVIYKQALALVLQTQRNTNKLWQTVK